MCLDGLVTIFSTVTKLNNCDLRNKAVFTTLLPDIAIQVKLAAETEYTDAGV